FVCASHPRVLHSFPTRRSSDLRTHSRTRSLVAAGRADAVDDRDALSQWHAIRGAAGAAAARDEALSQLRADAAPGLHTQRHRGRLAAVAPGNAERRACRVLAARVRRCYAVSTAFFAPNSAATFFFGLM